LPANGSLDLGPTADEETVDERSAPDAVLHAVLDKGFASARPASNPANGGKIIGRATLSLTNPEGARAMRSTRILALASAVLLLASGPALAQGGGRGGPAGARPDRPRPRVQIDPETDQVLLAIKAAVNPSHEQMEKLLSLYSALRLHQREIMRDAVQAFRGDTGRRRQGPGRQADDEAGRAARREAMIAAREKMVPLNDQFLADCRALLTSSQLEAWDGCAAELELMPRRRRNPGRGRGMLDPDRGPDVGDVAPDFELADLEGNVVGLRALLGKPVVIEFGSYTCPVFRRKVEAVEALRHDFGDAVEWVMIYTKEAHPTDGRVVEVNTRAGIEILQHTSFEKRLKCAALCREKLGLNLQVLVDGHRNKVTEAYSGHPNRGYVIGPDGKVVSRQVWFSVRETRKVLKQLLGRTPSTAPDEGAGVRPEAATERSD
jgi:peroxiredoxin